MYANRQSPWVEAYGQRNLGRVQVIDDIGAFVHKEPTRLVAVGEEDEVDRLSVSLSTSFDSRLNIIRSLPRLCEILHPESGKHRALAWLCRRLGVRQKQTAAFANGQEDISMLRWGGTGGGRRRRGLRGPGGRRPGCRAHAGGRRRPGA